MLFEKIHSTSPDGKKKCYLLLPDGPCQQLEGWEPSVDSRLYGCDLVLVRGLDWNNDLTPWAAEGVFKKAKPFGGKAEEFLGRLETEILEYEESSDCERTLLGLSLSGLFAVWAAHKSRLFSEIISISGSLWYDGFDEWIATAQLLPSVRKITLTLGDRERNSKDPRLAVVQDRTEMIAGHLGNSTEVEYILEPGVTHFTPVIDRLNNLAHNG